MDCFYDAARTSERREDGDMFLQQLGSENDTAEGLRTHSVERLVDEDYPPAYLIHSPDDAVAPFAFSAAMAKRLKLHGVPSFLHILRGGRNGFGVGVLDEAKGWLHKAVAFCMRKMRA